MGAELLCEEGLLPELCEELVLALQVERTDESQSRLKHVASTCGNWQTQVITGLFCACKSGVGTVAMEVGKPVNAVDLQGYKIWNYSRNSLNRWGS